MLLGNVQSLPKAKISDIIPQKERRNNLDFVIETIRALLSPTAWEMEIPRTYGLFHILVMVIGFSGCFFLAWRLRNLDERKNKAMILGFGIFLVVCEIYKQLMNEVVLYPNDGYNWGNFSFQLCSIPMYLCLMIPMLKPGNLRRSLYSFLMTYNLLGGFIAFFEPSGLFHGHVTLTAHALIWHMLLVFLGAYIALSGRGCRDIRDYRRATVLFLVLCAVAFGINCGFWEISNHQIKMFFIGPGNSPIIVFKQISEWFGWYVSTLLYIPVVCLGAYLIYLLWDFVKKKIPAPAMSC